VWNGVIRLELLTMPVKLYRAGQAEKVSFRQVQKETGARIRHALRTDIRLLDGTTPASTDDVAETVVAKPKPASAAMLPSVRTTATVQSAPLSRRDLAKGYEDEKGKFVCVGPDELAGLLPPTAHEIDIREFVRPVEIEPVFVAAMLPWTQGIVSIRGRTLSPE
jgi:hypothetical protein